MQKGFNMFGKLVNGNLEYASTKAIITDELVITNPQRDDYLANGYKEIVNNTPEDAEKEYVEEYTEQEDKIIINYKEV